MAQMLRLLHSHGRPRRPTGDPRETQPNPMLLALDWPWLRIFGQWTSARSSASSCAPTSLLSWSFLLFSSSFSLPFVFPLLSAILALNKFKNLYHKRRRRERGRKTKRRRRKKGKETTKNHGLLGHYLYIYYLKVTHITFTFPETNEIWYSMERSQTWLLKEYVNSILEEVCVEMITCCKVSALFTLYKQNKFKKNIFPSILKKDIT